MRGVYEHIAPQWRTDLVNGLQRTWEESLGAEEDLATLRYPFLTFS